MTSFRQIATVYFANYYSPHAYNFISIQHQIPNILVLNIIALTIETATSTGQFALANFPIGFGTTT